jgi:cob(I)alamin adenosyltransferase
MKLYTKTGDDGTTGLFGSGRVGKDSLRIEAVGAVDELNSAVGLAAAACRHERLTMILTGVQHTLFDVGAELVTLDGAGGGKGGESSASSPRIGPDHIAESERQIDTACEGVPPLTHFVLPGGCELAARLHVARAACRLAERRCLALSRYEPVGKHLLVYLNRLSDLLFAMARLANHLEGVADVVWPGRGV